MKACTKCLLVKLLRDFHKDFSRKDGLNYLCKNCHKSRLDSYRDKNPEKALLQSARYYASHKEEKKATSRANPNKRRNQVIGTKRYHTKYPDKRNANRAKYHASKLNRTPRWLTVGDKIEIAWAYKIANLRTMGTGIKHEVDHIVPLQGKNMSGLHVPWNLQILTREANIRKGNR